MGNLGSDGAVTNSRAVDLLDGLLLLGGVVELDKAKALGAAEGTTAGKAAEATDNVSGLDLDGQVGEEGTEALVVNREGKVGDKDGGLDRLVSATNTSRQDQSSPC